MPLFPNFFDFDPELIDILIKKEKEEKEEQNSEDYRPFLQIPVPSYSENPEIREISEKKEKNNEIIIIDL